MLSRGEVVSKIFNKKCSKNCTAKHEEVHKVDMTPCCKKAGKAYKKASTDTEKKEIERLWNQRKGINQNLLECRAYTESVKCLEKAIKDNQCHTPGPPDRECCTNLEAVLESDRDERDQNCKKLEYKKLVGCVFPRKTEPTK